MGVKSSMATLALAILQFDLAIDLVTFGHRSSQILSIFAQLAIARIPLLLRPCLNQL